MIDSTDEEPPECHECGCPMELVSDQRVVTTVEDGTAVHRHFCSDDCLERWESSQSA